MLNTDNREIILSAVMLHQLMLTGWQIDSTTAEQIWEEIDPDTRIEILNLYVTAKKAFH